MSELQNNQRKMILGALLDGNKLTPLDALERFGCMRLGARIYELKNEGVNICSTMVKTSTGKRVAQYWIPNVIKNSLFE